MTGSKIWLVLLMYTLDEGRGLTALRWIAVGGSTEGVMCSSEYGISGSGCGTGAALRTKSWNEGMFCGVVGVAGYVAIGGGLLSFCCFLGTAMCGCEILSVVFAISMRLDVEIVVRQVIR